MAITACMASPIFNTLFGLGIPTLQTLIKIVRENQDLPADQKKSVQIPWKLT
jgi:hypothetical protein